jgi:hypothetical protein
VHYWRARMLGCETPTQQRIACELDVGLRSVERAVGHLKSSGWIRFPRPGEVRLLGNPMLLLYEEAEPKYDQRPCRVLVFDRGIDWIWLLMIFQEVGGVRIHLEDCEEVWEVDPFPTACTKVAGPL